MENIRQKKKPCEEKEIFAPKMAAENAFTKRDYHFKILILNFKIQQKVRLNVYKKTLFEWKKSQKIKIIGFFKKITYVYCTFCYILNFKIWLL